MLAERGYLVTGVDTDRRAMALLAAIGRRRATGVQSLVGNATRLPCRSGAFATATSIHLLEHLDEADATRTVDELLRVCIDRVIVAVPFETEPTRAFGHVRCFDLARCAGPGRAVSRPTGRHGNFCHRASWRLARARQRMTFRGASRRKTSIRADNRPIEHDTCDGAAECNRLGNLVRVEQPSYQVRISESLDVKFSI